MSNTPEYPKIWELTLDGDTFNALKSDFNAVLRKTLSTMESKGSDAADMTVKVKISLKSEQAPEVDGSRNIVVPKFDHKVSSVMQIKDELTGTLGGNYELIWDAERGEYVMREITKGQQTIFEYCDEKEEVVDGDIVPDEQMLPGLKLLQGGESDDRTPTSTGCVNDFPSCLCISCKQVDVIAEGRSCCVQHGRDCGDTYDCNDYKRSLA